MLLRINAVLMVVVSICPLCCMTFNGGRRLCCDGAGARSDCTIVIVLDGSPSPTPSSFVNEKRLFLRQYVYKKYSIKV